MNKDTGIDNKRRYTMSYIFKKGKYTGYSVSEVIDKFNDWQYIDFLRKNTRWFNPSIYVRRVIRDKMGNAPIIYRSWINKTEANTARKKDKIFNASFA